MGNKRNSTIPRSADKFQLPDVLEKTLPQINQIMSGFHLPRNIIAGDDEIEYAWRELPREIERIPSDLRNELIVRMCIATSVGLFDGAINYIWNAVILTLKNKVKNFGLALVAQTLNKNFTEDDLNSFMDSQLLDLCYKIEILSEDGYFFLNQCRDIRNNFSTAHPSIARIDDRELINFISRCCKYGITDDYNLKGISVSDFVMAVKSEKLDSLQLEYWSQNLSNTFNAQRQLLVPMLMGIYCDPKSNEQTRLNALKICIEIKSLLDEKITSAMIEQYNQYIIKGFEDKRIAARTLFEKLELLSLLSSSEQHSIVKNACVNLLNAHMEYNNFYNEPPFAERLMEITSSISTPETVQKEFVYAVLMCYVGNPYGISRAAIEFYQTMILNFSPREIGFMLHLLDEKSLFSQKIDSYGSCKKRYIDALKLVDKASLNAKQIVSYDTLIAKLKKINI